MLFKIQSTVYGDSDILITTFILWHTNVVDVSIISLHDLPFHQDWTESKGRPTVPHLRPINTHLENKSVHGNFFVSSALALRVRHQRLLGVAKNEWEGDMI